MRLLIVARAIRNEFKHLLHPNAVLPVRINKQTVSSSIVTTVLIFFAFYLVLILIGWTALLFLGVGFSESVSTVISSIGNWELAGLHIRGILYLIWQSGYFLF